VDSPQELRLPEDQSGLITKEISELLAKRAIQEVPYDHPGFLSNLFLIRIPDYTYGR
ncbi:Hypothetical predicted protein, partial [Pelobates cultripes]